MEKQFFDWNDWDTIDTMSFQFYDCTLKQAIGKYEKGRVIESILIEFEESRMTFYDEDNHVRDTFKLKLVVE